MVEVQHLSKRFGQVAALKDINLSLEEGHIYGFIGPNGAGKTTTLRIMLGMLQATSGSVRLFGMDAWREAVQIHRRTAYVPGDANLWPNLTGGEVIDLLLRMRGQTDSSRKKELIERFQLDPTKKCRTYSKGNRQKVILVSAFAARADLYILDEPTSGLDPLMERVFQELVREAREEGKTILLSSHILSEVEKLCDRVAIIREGEIIEKGSLEELRHLTRNRFTLETRQPIRNLPELPGIYEAQPTEKGWTFQVDATEMSDLMRTLSSHGILRLEIQEPTLEDLFLRHYESPDASRPEGGGRR